MKKLTFDELYCKRSLQNPWYCHLEVKIDGSHLKEPYMLGAYLSAGDRKDPAAPFTKNFYFEEKISFSMELEDNWQLEIYTHEASDGDGAYVATFTHENQWEVDAEYTVTDMPDEDLVDKAIEEFRDGISVAENSDSFGRWHRLSHEDVVDRTEELLSASDEPYFIDQADVGYCGVVSIMFVSAYRQPRRFVETCRSLYETGGYLTQSNRETSSLALLNSPVPDDFEDLEWLYCGALRESGSVDDDISANNLEEGTQMDELGHWFVEVLGYNNVWKYNDHPLFDKRELIEKANEAIADGGAAAFNIDGELATEPVYLFPEENATSWFLESNHVVTMVESADVYENDPDDDDDDEIHMLVHDRGKVDFIALEWHYIEDYLFGMVVGWN